NHARQASVPIPLAIGTAGGGRGLTPPNPQLLRSTGAWGYSLLRPEHVGNAPFGTGLPCVAQRRTSDARFPSSAASTPAGTGDEGSACNLVNSRDELRRRFRLHHRRQPAQH